MQPGLNVSSTATMARVALVAFALSAGLLAYVKLGPELSPRLEDLDATPSGFSDPTLGEDISADLDNLLRPAMVRMRAQAKVHQDIVSQIYQVNTAPRCTTALCMRPLLMSVASGQSDAGRLGPARHGAHARTGECSTGFHRPDIRGQQH